MSTVSMARLPGKRAARALSRSDVRRTVAMTCQSRPQYSSASAKPRPREAPTINTVDFCVMTLLRFIPARSFRRGLLLRWDRGSPAVVGQIDVPAGLLNRVPLCHYSRSLESGIKMPYDGRLLSGVTVLA